MSGENKPGSGPPIYHVPRWVRFTIAVIGSFFATVIAFGISCTATAIVSGNIIFGFVIGLVVVTWCVQSFAKRIWPKDQN